MGYLTDVIVEQAVAHLAGRQFRRSDYEGFANAFGLSIEHTPRIIAPAYLLDTIIYVRAGQPSFSASVYVREEVAHYLTVEGSREFWRGCPQGDITFKRFERLARDVRVGLESAGLFLPN
jgi:hypothetical protein